MKEFKLTNLRQLTTEEQMRLNGGALPENCSADCTCKCTCTCNDKNPKSSSSKDCSNTGATNVSGAEDRKAMQKM